MTSPLRVNSTTRVTSRAEMATGVRYLTNLSLNHSSPFREMSHLLDR